MSHDADCPERKNITDCIVRAMKAMKAMFFKAKAGP